MDFQKKLGLLFFFIFCFAPFLYSQINLNGKWEGLLRQHIMGSFTDSPYQLNIEQKGDSLFGIAHIEASEFLSLYAEMSFTGYIKNNQISITENEFLNGTDLDDAIGWCIKALELTYQKGKKGHRLQGKWTGNGNSNGKPCKPGILYLDKLSANFTGLIKDSISNKLLGAEVYVINLTTKEKIASFKTYPSEGLFNFYADTANLYQVFVKKKGYEYKYYRFQPQEEGEKATILLKPIENGALLHFGNVRFMQSTPYLIKDSELILERIANFLKENSTIKLEISGHTSNEGDPVKNKQLSLERAKTVAAFLNEKGIDNNRIITLGFGVEKPIDTNETLTGRRINRRVEFRAFIE